MKTDRGISQILFGMLPDQTVDLEGRVWRVSRWVDPRPRELDQERLRRALLAALNPWTQSGLDNGVSEQLRSGTHVEVVELNVDRGIVVEPFPRQWRCRACGRISTTSTQDCPCGADAKAQMHFVAYHSCGALREPFIPRCHTHNSVAVRLPGSANARDIQIVCPVCGAVISQGFPFQRCDCDPQQGMSVTVHRAAVVYTPHYIVLVNPPDPSQASRFRSAGGGARALEWVLNGMTTTLPDAATGPSRQTYAGLVELLLAGGLSEATARELADGALARGEVERSSCEEGPTLSPLTAERAQDEALSLAYAAAGGRLGVSQLAEAAPPGLRELYETVYRDAIRDAGLCNVELLSNFPVATLAFGYTRGEANPGTARLVPFRAERGGLRTYAAVSGTEALLFQLDPLRVVESLDSRGYVLGPCSSQKEARLAILRSLVIPMPGDPSTADLGSEVLTLLHSYAHRAIRRLAVYAGIERESLAEYLLPHHLSFVVYASSRGDFVLGGLQSVFERSLHEYLEDLVIGESRCPLDPGCRNGGGACMACLHLGEPSCRWFNRFLSRDALFGPEGFLHRGNTP